MTGDMSAVVAQLLELRERLAATAVIAMRAKADAEHGHDQYAEAARGTTHPRLQQAMADMRIVGDKSARIARLLNKARDHVTAYLNRIAPGAVQDGGSHAGAMPTGEQLLADAERRANAKASVGSFLRRAVKNVENIQDSTKTATELGETGVKILRSPSGPKGAQSTSTTTPSSATTVSRPKMDVPEAAAQIAVLGIMTAVAIHKTSQVLGRTIARWRNR